MADLLEAILLSEQIAICKCEAYTNNVDSVSQGNAQADAAAKRAASLSLNAPQLVSFLQGAELTVTGWI